MRTENIKQRIEKREQKTENGHEIFNCSVTLLGAGNLPKQKISAYMNMEGRSWQQTLPASFCVARKNLRALLCFVELIVSHEDFFKIYRYQ